MFFLERLLAEIDSAGITKNKLLTDLGLSKNSFVAWDNRGTVPSGETLDKLANYFDVTTDYLLGRTDDPTPPNGGKASPELSRDAVESELITHFDKLYPEELKSALEFAEFLIYRRDKKPPKAP